MPRIVAKKIPKKVESVDDILAVFCYYFPQYTYAQSKKMPYVRVKKMINAVRKEKARDFFELTKIAAAPQSKKGVKSLLEYYKSIIDQ